MVSVEVAEPDEGQRELSAFPCSWFTQVAFDHCEVVVMFAVVVNVYNTNGAKIAL